MKRTKITILFPELRDITTIREKTRDMAYMLREGVAYKLHTLASKIDAPFKGNK